MYSYIGKRLLVAIPTLLIISDLRLLAAEASAGRPGAGHGRRGARSAGARAAARKIPAERSGRLSIRLLAGRAVAKGDLGISLRTNQPVLTLIAEKLPVTIQLAVMSMSSRFVIGIPDGHPGSSQEEYRSSTSRQYRRALRPVDPEFLARHHADPADFGEAWLAAGLGLRSPSSRIRCTRSRPCSCRPSCSAMRSRPR